ncbi:MAG: hypothetical protein J6A58_11730 [Oscillospiraceae bacterium]|nr:hypothetical protein [Oscillospiraceae bacterium]
MATSSITHNFVITGKEHIEAFANAIEKSVENISPTQNQIKYTEIKTVDELKKLLAKRKNS